MCDSYICNYPPEVQIYIDEKDIEAERLASKGISGENKEDYFETLAVYRKISEEMLQFDTFLMHGAVVAEHNKAYLFTAESGTGKTTHIRKWIKNIDGSIVVNGDKPLIKVTDTQVFACGTPWCGKEHMNTNTVVPLRAVVLMERGSNNVIEEVSYGQAFSFLLYQTYCPKDIDKLKKTLTLLSRMKGKVRFFKFRFNNYKSDAFEVAYKALTCERLEDVINTNLL